MKLTERFRAIALLEGFILPIPLIAFATDRPYVASFSLLVFLLASLALPCTVRQRQVKRKGTSIYAPVGIILYSGIIALIVAIGILNGLMLSPLWHAYGSRVALFFGWMVGTVAVQTILSWLFGAWWTTRRTYWFSEFLDPLLFALPIPCAILGMFVFPGTGGDGVTSSLIIGILGIISFSFIGIGILTMATFAFYFYPKPELYPRLIDKIVGLVRIVIMTLVFLGIHYVFFHGDEMLFRLFLYYGLPLTQNNPIVFVTPFILESVIIVVSIAVSNLVTMALQGLLPKA